MKKNVLEREVKMTPVEMSDWLGVEGGQCGGIFIGTKDGLYSVCVTAWWE